MLGGLIRYETIDYKIFLGIHKVFKNSTTALDVNFCLNPLMGSSRESFGSMAFQDMTNPTWAKFEIRATTTTASITGKHIKIIVWV